MGYQPKTYRDEGGDKIVVASGGVIDIESGGSFKIAGTAVTASASELNALGGSATDFDCGASGTAGSLDIFPAAATNGKLIHTCTNNGAARNLTLTNVAQTSGSGTLKYPDMAGGTGQFVATNADQKCTVVTGASDRTITLGGDLTTTAAVSITGAFTTAAAVTFSGAFASQITVPDASTWVLPAGGGTLALVTGAESGTTASSFTVDSDSSTGKFALAVNTAGTNHTVTLKAPVTSQAVTLTLPDAAADTLCAIAATQTLAAKTLTTPVINGCTTASAAGNFVLNTSSGTFSTPSGTFTFYGNVANNGNITFDFSGSNGAFSTSTGANSLNGHVTIATAKNLTLTNGYVSAGGSTSGSIKIAPTATGTNETSIVNQGGGSAKVITLPPATATLATIGLAETLDTKTLTNAGAITQTGAVGITTGTAALSLNGSATLATTKTLTFGSSAAGTATPITCYSLTGSKGAFIIACADNTTDHTVTLTNGTANGGSAVITTPATTCTLVGRTTTDTLTGKSIDGDDNTLTDLGPKVHKAGVVGTRGSTNAVGGGVFALNFLMDNTAGTSTWINDLDPARSVKVLQVWGIKTASLGGASDTVGVGGSGGAIIPQTTLTIADTLPIAFASFDDSKTTIAHDATITVTTVKGTDHCECEVTVLCMWI